MCCSSQHANSNEIGSISLVTAQALSGWNTKRFRFRGGKMTPPSPKPKLNQTKPKLGVAEDQVK